MRIPVSLALLLFAAIAVADHPAAATLTVPAGGDLQQALNAARPGDTIEISTRLTGNGKSAGFWTQEIRRAGTGERVARNECVTVWRSENNCVMPWPTV